MRRFLKLKAFFLFSIVVLSILMVLPSVAKIARFEDRLPTWISETFSNQFTLGLDLQGGLHLEYSVAVDEAIENKLDQIASELEAGFRQKKDIEVRVEREGIDRINIYFPSPEDVATATDDVLGIALAEMERVDTEDEASGVIHLKMREEQLAESRKAAVSQALETVRRRIDAMGIAEPNIYPKNRHVVIELPGLDNEATAIHATREDAAFRLSELLREQGASQVQVTNHPLRSDAFSLRIPEQNAQQFLTETFGQDFATSQIIQDPKLPYQLEVVSDEQNEATDTVLLALTEEAKNKALEESSGFRRLLKVIERAAVLEMHMIDDEYVLPSTDKPYLQAIYQANLVTQGMGIAVNRLPKYGHDDGVWVEDPFVFYAKDRDKLEQFFANLPEKWKLPASHRVVLGRTPMMLRKDEPPEQIWQTYVIKTRTEVTGDRIVSAGVDANPETGIPEVNLTLDSIGAEQFEKMSGANVGRKMAIMMDEEVISDPVFNSRIPGGRVRITMGETPGMTVREAANDLVKVLKSGSLPARMVKEFEIRVGADLGRESVEKGFWALVVGLSAVIIFMVIYYRRSGFIAFFALVLNILLIMAAMAFFNATLTLPGIAALVLTIGMAVDANVIIYERIRELILEGYKARAAIEAGFSRAMTTILDSQLTTAIAGVVLWQFGSGPIRGFAITLLIGIVTSIFTAVFCSRLFFDFQANRRGFDRVSI